MTPLINRYGSKPLTAFWRETLGRLGPPVHVCRHREWTKFGTYSEATLRRLVDDLC